MHRAFSRASVFTSLLLAASTPLVAQRGGNQGPDNRPEVTFPVNLPPDDAKLAALKKEAMHMVDSMSTFSQQMVDMVFSFGELGMQEEETSKYLTGILEKNGFKVTRGFAGIPTAWVATWGSGKPVISLGSDVDDIPQANQKPGVGYKDPMIVGAPGHGEGHNSGVPMNITAAIAVKKIMEREHMQGTIHLWPGIAEEQMAAKAYFVREGMFKDVDVCLFAHVGTDLGVSYGQSGQNALISARFNFQGSSAHAAGAPWAGRSALDAVELMDVGWNFRREHLPLDAALALRDHRRRRPAERRAADGVGLVLLPRDQLAARARTVRARRHDGARGGDDDEHQAGLRRHPRLRLVRSLQQGDRRRHVRQHQAGWHADVERRGSNAGEGHPARAWPEGSARSVEPRPDHARPRRRAPKTFAAAAATTSATCRGTCRRSRSAIRRTFPACLATTGRTRSRWRRRSRTRA